MLGELIQGVKPLADRSREWKQQLLGIHPEHSRKCDCAPFFADRSQALLLNAHFIHLVLGGVFVCGRSGGARGGAGHRRLNWGIRLAPRRDRKEYQPLRDLLSTREPKA